MLGTAPAHLSACKLPRRPTLQTHKRLSHNAVMEEQPKRKRTFRQDASRKKTKSDDGAGSFSGFGAKMMAKMGWSKGEGLGREGEGIQEPIQVQLRNTKGGVGAVSEKSEQQKREERRRAEQNGEKYDDSSEDERARHRKKKATSGTSTPSTAAPRPKKTIYDLEAAGMQVPPTLQSIVDATTGESKSTSALSLRGAEVPFQTSLAARVQREVAAFGDAVEAVQTDAKNIEHQMDHLAAELESLSTQIAEIQDISSRLEELRAADEWSTVVDGLKSLQAAYPARSFHKEAVAVINPLFLRSIAAWNPTSEALEHVSKSLGDLGSIIDPSSQAADYRSPSDEVTRPFHNPLASIFNPNSQDSEPTYRRSTTPYQTMMFAWWSRFHSAMVNDFEPDGPSSPSFVHAIEVWRPVLPRFIFRRITQEIKRKVSASLQRWNPRKAIKHKSSAPLPQWIFQWLPYDGDIRSEVRPKLRTVLQIWPIHRGIVPGIKLWTKAFSEDVDTLLVRHLLPRLSAHLRDDFEMDPADQDVAPISIVIGWASVMSPRIIAELLHAEFFTTKFYACLHSWLTYEGRNFDEIRRWLSWWKEIFPNEINNVPIIERDWEEAYKLVHAALDLQGGDLENLALPAVGPPRSPSPKTPNFSKSVNTVPPLSARQEVDETTFKDIVEAWCAEENLLLIPLRKADEKTGLPLFRVTASATGKGGVVVYIKGDIVWAQDKKDKSVWEPVGLEEGLISRAEGK